MKKSSKLLSGTLLLAVLMSFSVSAAGWQKNDTGWWYQTKSGAYLTNCWQWIDGNHDGLSECYYFDENGYLLVSTVTPDGYSVNADGAWIQNGMIQQKTNGPAGTFAITDAAKQAYLQANQKSQALNSLSAHSEISMEMSMNGTTVPMESEMSIKMKGLQSGNLDYLVTSRNNVMGVLIESTSFYKDGWYYTETAGTKMKLQMPLTQIMEQAKQTASSFDADLSYFDRLQLTDNADGSKQLSYTIDPASMNNQIIQLYDTFGFSEMGAANMTIHQMHGTMLINPDGYCSKHSLTLVMDMTINGETVSASMNMSMSYDNPGQEIDFTLPSTEGFTDITSVQPAA